MKQINNNIESKSGVITEAEGIKVGDKVKVRGHDTPATVTAITQEGCYKVRYAAPVLSFWEMKPITESTYTRSSITRNYDPLTGQEIEGNATYYREQLTGDWWEDDEVINFFGKEIFRPTERRKSWLVADDIFSDPRELTLSQLCEELAALYAKEHKAA